MRKQILFLAAVIGLQFFCSASFAKFEFEKNCGSAKVTSGDTCSNVKVELNLADCDQSLATIQAPKIVCKDREISARYESGNFRYEARFDKMDDGWGGITWKQVGNEVAQYKKAEKKKSGKTAVAAAAKPAAAEPPPMKKAAPPVAAAPAPAPAPAAESAPVVAAAPASASPFKFSGFFDVGLNNFSVSNNASFSGAPESGFNLQDGAFYGSYEKGPLSFTMDVPFRREETRDINPASTTPNASNNNNAIFGADKFQLYAKYKFNDEADLIVGQFDTIFGVEVNDSKDRYFEKTGLLYDNMLPVTHTGAMFEYAKSGASAKIFAANPNNKGSLGTSTGNQGDTNYEYGGAVGYSNEMIRGQAGYMTRPVNKANLQNGGKRNLLDLTAGATWKAFSIDFEYDYLPDDSKNTLTPLDNTDKEDAGTGFMALASYQINDPLSVGVRFETMSNDPSQNSWKGVQDVAAGVHYHFNSSFEARAEYISYWYKNVDTTTFTANRATLAGLFFF